MGAKSNSQDELRCPKNTFASGLYVRFGEVIDSFGLRCAPIQGAVQKELISVTLTSLEKVYPYSTKIGINDSTGGSGEGLLSFTRVDNGSATGCALENGVISAVTPGTCKIEVTKAGDGFFGQTTLEIQFSFSRSQQSIEITSLASIDKVEGLSQNLSPVTTPPLGSGAITYLVRDGTAQGPCC